MNPETTPKYVCDGGRLHTFGGGVARQFEIVGTEEANDCAKNKTTKRFNLLRMFCSKNFQGLLGSLGKK